MQELHKTGGVPLGWRFTPPPGSVEAGRQVFVDNGCHSCHAVQGETFPTAPGETATSGPDLTGMGGHHPAEYFVESILNPDAVLVDGPGYISAGGRSTMPSYPDMTLKQLADVVAYLKSLTAAGSGAQAHCAPGSAAVAVGASNAPAAFGYVAQAFEVDDTRLEDFYEWFDRKGFAGYPGLMSIDTYASRLHDGRHLLLCLFGFDGEVSLSRFAEEIKSVEARPDDFVHPAQGYLLQTPPLYHAPQMSIP
jgi:mono/diheme cytochrome c family protein